VVIATADLADGGHGIAPALQWRSFGGRAEFAGAIATIECSEDNGLLKAVLGGPGEGRVLVVDGHGSLRRALVGDRVAGLALANGWAGLVINGAVRDVAGLAAIPLGVLALGSNPMRCTGEGSGTSGGAVTFGGVDFRPGEYLVADLDGVVVCSEAPAD
jgi:regulator of ribonuclease activity A